MIFYKENHSLQSNSDITDAEAKFAKEANTLYRISEAIHGGEKIQEIKVWQDSLYN